RGQRLEVVLELVRQRLPQLGLPVELRVQPREPPERPVVQHDGGPDRVRPAVVRQVAFGQALAQRVDVPAGRVRPRIPLHDQPVDPLLELRRDLLPHLVGAGLEFLESHARSTRRSARGAQPTGSRSQAGTSSNGSPGRPSRATTASAPPAYPPATDSRRTGPTRGLRNQSSSNESRNHFPNAASTAHARSRLPARCAPSTSAR